MLEPVGASPTEALPPGNPKGEGAGARREGPSGPSSLLGTPCSLAVDLGLPPSPGTCSEGVAPCVLFAGSVPGA